jgi:hypothetical protein
VCNRVQIGAYLGAFSQADSSVQSGGYLGECNEVHLEAWIQVLYAASCIVSSAHNRMCIIEIWSTWRFIGPLVPRVKYAMDYRPRNSFSMSCASRMVIFPGALESGSHAALR